MAGSPTNAPTANAGEVIIYAGGGQEITLDNDGNINITGATNINIDGARILKEGDQVSIPCTTPDTITGTAQGEITLLNTD